ncbi:MAG: sensor domain-containing diguanylate cyclase [Chloroflexota bacterium]
MSRVATAIRKSGANRITAFPGEGELWALSLELLSHTLKASQCSLMFLDDSSKDLVVVKTLEPDNSAIPGSRIKLGEGTPGKAAENKETRVGRETDHCGERQDVGGPVLSVPIVAEGRLHGVLSAIRNQDDDSFSSFDIATAELIAQNLAIHIQNEVVRQEIGRLAIIDSLTSLHNRRFFEDAIDREVARARRFWHSLCLVILDVNNFKKINDQLGHPAGDAVLKSIGIILQNVTRQSDVVCRYGGDEFAVLLPQTDREGALRAAKRMMTAVSAYPFEFNDRVFPKKVRVSIGISGYPYPATNKADLLQQTDDAMYRAKRNGSRQPIFWEGDKSPAD